MRLFLAVGCIVVTLTLSLRADAQTAKGNARKGLAVYEHNCLRCHGPALDGRGPDAPKLIRPPANFHDRRSRKRGDAEMEIVIKQGQTFTDMHSWDDRLTDQQIRDVIAYIRTYAPHIIE
jgi:mono/diheme cytochrome c family protein